MKQQPDLNWRNPAVADAVFDMLSWWLERGIDGFRRDRRAEDGAGDQQRRRGHPRR